MELYLPTFHQKFWQSAGWITWSPEQKLPMSFAAVQNFYQDTDVRPEGDRYESLGRSSIWQHRAHIYLYAEELHLYERRHYMALDQTWLRDHSPTQFFFDVSDPFLDQCAVSPMHQCPVILVNRTYLVVPKCVMLYKVLGCVTREEREGISVTVYPNSKARALYTGVRYTRRLGPQTITLGEYF